MSRRMMLLLFPSSFFSLVYYCTLLGTMVWFGILRGGKWVRGAHKERRPKATLLHGGGKRQIRYKQSISRFGEGYSRKWGWGKCSLGPNHAARTQTECLALEISSREKSPRILSDIREMEKANIGRS